MAGGAFYTMARTIFDGTTLAVLIAVCTWVIVVSGCVVGEIYPQKFTRESLARSYILRSWLCMNIESSRLLVMFAIFIAPKIRLSRFSPRLEALELELLRHSQILMLLTTEEIQESLRPYAEISSEVQLEAPSPVRKQIELLRAKADVTHFRRLSIDFEMKLEDAEAQHKKLEATIARRIEVIGKLHADHADEKGRLYQEMDELKAKAAEEKHQCEVKVKELHKLIVDLKSSHGRALAIERVKAADSLAKAQGRINNLALELEDAQKVNNGFSVTIHALQSQKKEISVKLSNSQAAVLQEKRTVVRVRQKCSLLQNKLSLVQQNHRKTVHHLLVSLAFLWRFSRYLGERLVMSARSRDTLLVQWKVLSQQKVQSQRALIRSLNMSQSLQTQLRIQEAARVEADQDAQVWLRKFVDSLDKRQKASIKFSLCIRFTKGRFNETTRRLLTGILVLWRLNLLLSQRLAMTSRVLRADEDDQPVENNSLARIEEVSEPSGSRSSIASLVEATSENSVSLASGGLGLTPDPPRLTSEASIQTVEEPPAPSLPSVKDEHLVFQSCGADTTDIEPAAVDTGVMTDLDPEEILLRERISRLNKKFNAMETIDSIYLRHLVKPQQSPQSSPIASPSPSRLPFGGRIGIPIMPSAVRQPFISQPSLLAGYGNRQAQKARGRIFSQALDDLPFPQRAYTRQEAGPSTPTSMAGPPQTPGTPTPASAAAHRQPFLLSNTPGNVSFN